MATSFLVSKKEAKNDANRFLLAQRKATVRMLTMALFMSLSFGRVASFYFCSAKAFSFLADFLKP